MKKLKLFAGAVLACASLQVSAASPAFGLPALSLTFLATAIPAAGPFFLVISGLGAPGYAAIDTLSAPLSDAMGRLPALPGLPSP